MVTIEADCLLYLSAEMIFAVFDVEELFFYVEFSES